ncbi:MAG: transporter substrate-binding domain-containing protein [Spirochaetia bacterium]|nr:transporter substrate-binding domain-containing protein [Spirochaetia bacterium]
MKFWTVFALTLLTLGFGRSWEQITSSKELRVGIRVREGVMSAEKNSGFHYDLARAFAKKNNLELKLVVKQNLQDYFSGSVFSECDIVADNVTILSDREKSMDFAELLPIKQILVSKKGHTPVRNVKLLADDTIIVAKDSAYYPSIQAKEKEAGVVFKYFFSSSAADQLKDLMAEKGTITILDSNLAALSLTDGALTLHGAVSAKQFVGWGFEKGQSKTGEAVKAFVSEAKSSGTFSKIWDKYIEGISYEDYLKLAQ